MKNVKKKKNRDAKTNLIRKIIFRIKALFYDEEEERDNDDGSFSIFEVLIITVISIFFGIIVGYFVNPLNRDSESSELNEIMSVYKNIKDNYYGNLDEKKLADAAIKGMVDSLEDPYSNYMDNATTDDFNESVDGEFVGVGVTIIYEDGYNKIIDVNKNGPADKAGLKKGDILLKIDGKDVKEVFGSQITALVRGKKGTKVEFTIKRDNEEKKFTIKRDTIEVVNVTGNIIEKDNKNIGYINISIFSSNTFKQFNKELKKQEKKGIDSLILDVRDNPGGHLNQLNEILSLFFNKKTVLYQMQAKDSKEKVYSLNNEKRDYSIVILMNENSASASEILASCFQDNYKNSLVIGKTSYGKGTVQKSRELNDGTSIKYTVNKWLTSKGKWINEVGVKPDVDIEQSEEYYNSPTQVNDKQLQEALTRIIGMK